MQTYGHHGYWHRINSSYVSNTLDCTLSSSALSSGLPQIPVSLYGYTGDTKVYHPWDICETCLYSTIQGHFRIGSDTTKRGQQ